MIKNKNLQKFNKLGFKQKVYCLLNIFYFIVYIFKLNFTSLSKTARRKNSIKYINKLLNESTSQIDSLDNDDFDEVKIKSCHDVDNETLSLLERVNHKNKIESFTYELITMPSSGSFFQFILNLKLPLLMGLKTSIYNITDAYLELGEIFLKDRVYELANRYLNEALQIYKNDCNIYYLLGISFSNEASAISRIESGNFILQMIKGIKYNRALAKLEMALKWQSNNELILKEMGDIHYKLNEFDLAIENYEKILKLNPKNIKIYEKIGNIYKKMNLKIKADAYYKKAAELNGKEKITPNNVITIPNFNNENQSDITYLGNESENIINSFARAVLMSSENSTESVKEFQKAISFMLKDIDYYIYMAYTYKNNNLIEIANEYMNVALNVLDNNILFLKYIHDRLRILLENYLPVKSIKNRINVISDYYNKNI